ncbi:MAG: ROK family transcriptional regulator [Caldilineaceae bacterium]|nr:ROK family transcriptional regulator [Caldilineaceae bacterium]
MTTEYVTGDSQQIRRINQEAILRLVQQRGPISRIEISEQLGLNPSTVNRLVDQLADSRLLWMDGEQSAGRQGGRPARLVRFNGDAACIAAVDLSNVPWRAALVNLNGDVVERFHAMPQPGDAEANLAVLADLLDEIVAAGERRHGSPLWGIGIGAPSIVLSQTGTVVWAASLGWRDFPLKTWIEARWPVPVFVENDVNLLALGESRLGAGQQAGNLVVMAVGTGIGAGIILNGRLYRGASEAAGEIGYIPPNIAALGRSYTGYGPLEALAAAPGLVARAQAALQDEVESLLVAADPLDADAVYVAARSGDPVARQLVAETVDYLSLAVAALAIVLNPELILLGGEMAKASDLLLSPIRERLAGLLPALPRLEPVCLGEDGVILGAVALVLQSTYADVAGLQVAWP